MIDVKVNDKCNGCGGCLDSDYFEEMDNGCAQIIPGTIIPDNALDELKTIRDECPCQAIDINGARKSSREIANELLRYIDEIKEVIHISDVDEIAMDPTRHWINFDVHLTGYENGFRSYESAYGALRSEIHRIWDDRKDYALNEAQKYVNEDLRKYWDINNEEGIFAETQEKLKNAVYAISNSLLDSNLIEKPLSEEDYSVCFTEWITRQLLVPERLSKEWAQKVYDQMDYNNMLCALHKAEIKPYETYEAGLFGKMKDKTRWEYYGAYDSEEYIQKEIKEKLSRVSMYDAKKEINCIIDEYNKQLSEIKNKLVQLVKDNSNKLEAKKKLKEKTVIINEIVPKSVSVEIMQEEKNISTWLSRVIVPEGNKIMSLSEVIERREYGVPDWKEKDCEHLGKREYRSLWCDFDASPIIYDQTLKEVISDKNKYTKFLQDHFYRMYKGYPLHAWYRLPEEEKEILFYNRIAYECGHPEYMIATSNTNGYTFESSREKVGVRKNDTVYRKMGK